MHEIRGTNFWDTLYSLPKQNIKSRNAERLRQRERWKTTIGLISKKATLHVQYTFFLHFFAVVLYGHNVKLPETPQLHVLRRKCRTCSWSHFFHCHSFSPWWPLAFFIFSPPLQNFHVVLPTKKCLLYLSLALAVCRPFSRWASLACRLLSLFRCLSVSLYFKFVNMTILLSLLHWATRIQKRFPLSVFLFTELSLLHKTRVAKRFPANITSSCIWVCHTVLFELFYIGMPVVLMDGRSGVRSRDYQNFSDR